MERKNRNLSRNTTKTMNFFKTVLGTSSENQNNDISGAETVKNRI